MGVAHGWITLSFASICWSICSCLGGPEGHHSEFGRKAQHADLRVNQCCGSTEGMPNNVIELNACGLKLKFFPVEAVHQQVCMIQETFVKAHFLSRRIILTCRRCVEIMANIFELARGCSRYPQYPRSSISHENCMSILHLDCFVDSPSAPNMINA